MIKKTKDEAVDEFVSRDLNSIPTEWVKIVLESQDDYRTLPMWGTMWIIDCFGGDLYEKSRVMYESIEEFKNELDSEVLDADEFERLSKAIEDEDWSVLGDYIDEDMAGEHCILDKDGNTTALFIYEVDGQYVIGVNGAGFNFYSGVWDRLYDTIGLEWHTHEE